MVLSGITAARLQPVAIFIVAAGREGAHGPAKQDAFQNSPGLGGKKDAALRRG